MQTNLQNKGRIGQLPQVGMNIMTETKSGRKMVENTR